GTAAAMGSACRQEAARRPLAAASRRARQPKRGLAITRRRQLTRFLSAVLRAESPPEVRGNSQASDLGGIQRVEKDVQGFVEVVAAPDQLTAGRETDATVVAALGKD